MTTTITIDGITVRRQLGDDPAAPPLLFVHGFFGDATVWDPMMAWFVTAGYACHAINLRGRNGSGAGAVDLGRVTLEDYADDVAAVAATLDRPVIIGHSMGGLVTQMVGMRGMARALVLLAPAPPRGIPIANPRLIVRQLQYLPEMLLSRPIHPRTEYLEALAMNCVPPEARPALLASMVPDSGTAARQMGIVGAPVDPARIRAPMLVITGDEDRFIPLGTVRRVAKRYGAAMEVAAGRGHMLVVEPGWEELAASVDRWIRAHA